MKKRNVSLLTMMACSAAFLAGCGGRTSSTHTHKLGDLIAKVDATCEEDGHEAYYRCDDCGALFDVEKKETTSDKLVIEALGHDWVFVPGKPATCDEPGYKDYYDCSRCEKYAEDIKGEYTFLDLDAWKQGRGNIPSGNHDLSRFDGVPSTCTTDGYKDYYYCVNCGQYFEDPAGENPISDLEAWKKDPEGGYLPAGHHLEEHEARPATGLSEGNTYYAQCSICGDYFSDSEGKHQIEKDSWIIPALGTLTYETAAQIEESTSKEGDVLPIDKYGIGQKENYICTLDPAGTHEGQSYNGYLEFADLKGIEQVSIVGNGKIALRSGTINWAWETVTYFFLDEANPLTLDLDPDRTNSIIIASGGEQVSLKKLAFKSALKEGEGSEDADLLQHATIHEGMTSNYAYGYFTDKRTNGSSSALVAGATSNVEGWPFVAIQFENAINMYGKNLSFDAKGVIGRNRISIILYDENFARIGAEVGYDLTDSWAKYYYTSASSSSVPAKYMTITVFTTSVSSIHEVLVDNLKVEEAGLVTETNVSAWSYRAFEGAYCLNEADYLNKAVALDFKPETANASFEVDFMSSADFYVGRKNYIDVVDGVPTSTFGRIIEKGEGWYTLLVSEKNLSHIDRYSHGTTINGIYLATDYAMTGSVTFNYRSIRAVEDVAPTRQIITYTQAGSGHTFWNTDVVHVTNVSSFKAEGSAVMLALKATGSVGGTFSFNFAPTGAGEPIIKTVRFTLTEDGLAPSVGKVVYAEDGWCYFFLKNTEVDQSALGAASDGTTLNVFWLGEAFSGIDSVSFDNNCFKIYQGGIIA